MHQHSHYRDPRRKRETYKRPEKVFEEIVTENFPKMGKETITRVHEAQTVSGRINIRRNIPRQTNQMDKNKDKEKNIKKQ